VDIGRKTRSVENIVTFILKINTFIQEEEDYNLHNHKPQHLLPKQHRKERKKEKQINYKR